MVYIYVKSGGNMSQAVMDLLARNKDKIILLSPDVSGQSVRVRMYQDGLGVLG
jgi:5S rRNA maturation endonuclease (ribonuclease M5)